jgi:hypothetical protein
MRTRLATDLVPSSSRRGRFGRPLGALLLLLLGWGSAAPANAVIVISANSPYVINGPVTENVYLINGEVDIGPGGSVDTSASGVTAIDVEGGTLKITGGSVIGRIKVDLGTVMISGGSISDEMYVGAAPWPSPAAPSPGANTALWSAHRHPAGRHGH